MKNYFKVINKSKHKETGKESISFSNKIQASIISTLSKKWECIISRKLFTTKISKISWNKKPRKVQKNCQKPLKNAVYLIN